VKRSSSQKPEQPRRPSSSGAKDAAGLRAVRSRLLILVPFTFTLLTTASGYLLMQRYKAAIAADVASDPLALARFQQASGMILIGLGIFSFLVGVGIVFGIRKSLRTLSEEVDKLARGKFDIPLHHATEDEIDRLQSDFGNMVQALNRMIQETGMGAIITVDMEGNVHMLNALAQLLLEVKPNQVIGQPLKRLFHTSNGNWNAEIVHALEKSLATQEPLVDRIAFLTLPRGRKVQVKLRTSFFVAGGFQRMSVVLVHSQAVTDIMDVIGRIERAARFFTLGSLAANLAHEVRNPLASISGLVEILKEETPDEAVKSGYINHIERAAERLNRLIEGLLNVAALERCDLTPQAPREALEEIMGGKQYEARRQGKELVVRYGENLPLINCNRQWLALAVRNVVDNAIDASPKGGTITVEVSHKRISEPLQGAIPHAQCLDISVHNTGSFIPEERREAIFEPFETTKEGGTGLGLCIAQQIVQAHGGVLFVESDPETGTRFTFRISAIH